MSFYNMMFGVNPNSDELLGLLGLKKEDVPRFRDCGVEDDYIVILTRTGGGNREGYEEENEALCQVEGYVRDEDADFDSTYACFYFKPTITEPPPNKALHHDSLRLRVSLVVSLLRAALRVAKR